MIKDNIGTNITTVYSKLIRKICGTNDVTDEICLCETNNVTDETNNHV